MDIGFIGVGRMGTGMVANLIKGGQKVWAYDISPEAIARAETLGATGCRSVREASAGRDAVVLSLMMPKTVEDVILGPEGVVSASPVPPLLIDTTTMPPAVVKRLAAATAPRGCRLLEAPVSGQEGGQEAATAGTLTVMAGGPADVYESALPVLRLIGTKVFHLGEYGAGNTMKLVNNLIGHVCRAGIAEGLMLGTLSGINPKTLCDVISVSSGNSRVFQTMARHILAGNFEPGGVITSVYKALASAAELGEEHHLPMPVVNATKEVFQAAMAAGLGESEVSAFITLYERLMKVEVRGT